MIRFVDFLALKDLHLKLIFFLNLYVCVCVLLRSLNAQLDMTRNTCYRQ